MRGLRRLVSFWLGLLCNSRLQIEQVCKQELPAHSPARGERGEKDKTPRPPTLRLLPEENGSRCQIVTQEPSGAEPTAWLGRGCIKGCGRLRICPGCSSVTRCRKSDAAMLPAVSCHSNPPKHALLPPSFVSAPPSLASPPRCPTHKTCCTTPKSLHMLLKGCSSPQGRKGGRGGSPLPQAIIPTCFTGKVPTLDPGASHPTVPSPEVQHRKAGQPDLGCRGPSSCSPCPAVAGRDASTSLPAPWQ